MAQAGAADVPEIPTAILTRAYASFSAGPHLLDWPPRINDTRLHYILVFWVGVFLGACISRYAGVWVGFLLSTILKFLALVLVALASSNVDHTLDMAANAHSST